MKEILFSDDDIISIGEKEDRIIKALKKKQPQPLFQLSLTTGIAYGSGFRQRIFHKAQKGEIKIAKEYITFRKGGRQLAYLIMLSDFDYQRWKKTIMRRR